MAEPTIAEITDTREPAYWSRTLIAIAIAGVVVATISFLLRMASRQLTSQKLAIEDGFMAIGLIFSYFLSACVIVASFNGVGHNIWALPRQTQERVALIFFLGQKSWALAHVFVKLSIILLIRRLLNTIGHWQAVITGLIFFTIAWGITNVVGNTLQCLPPRYFWDRTIEGGHCPSNTEAFTISIGSLALAEDVVLLLIPVGVVWRMKLAKAEKFRLTFLFAIGGVVCIFGILRVVELIHYQRDNLTASGALEVTWALLELNLGIICANLVLMRPLLRACRATLSKCCRRDKKEVSVEPLAPSLSSLDSPRSSSSNWNMWVYSVKKSLWGSSTSRLRERE